MPQYVMRCLNIHPQSISSTQSSLPKLRYMFESSIIPRTIEEPFRRILFNPVPVNKECIYGRRTEKLELFDRSQNHLNIYHHTDYALPQKTARLPLIPREVLITNETAVQKYRQLCKSKKTDPSEVAKKSTKKYYKRPNREVLNVYLKKFAEQMSKNITEFETFCSTADTTHLRKKHDDKRNQ